MANINHLYPIKTNMSKCVYPSLINVTGRRGMVWMAGDAETALNTGRNRSEVKDHI